MAARPSSPASDLAELVTCSICLESFKDARALPCVHSFCKECLQGLLTPRGKITCPHCRLEVDVPNGDVSNLNPNFFVTNVLDVLNSSDASLSLRDTIQIAHTPTTTTTTRCKNHPEKECELFCQHCSKLICYKCISNWGTCGQHLYESIETAVNMMRENVEDLLRKREEILPSVIRHVVLLTDMKAKQSENMIDVSKQISDTFSNHIEALKTRQGALVKQAFDMQWKNDDCLCTEVERIQMEQAKIENTIEFCRKILDVNEPGVFLQAYSAFKDKVFQTNSPKELVSHVEVGTLCFQATESLLTDVISNFGNVEAYHEGYAAKEEKPVREKAKRSLSKQKKLPTSERPANEHRPSNEHPTPNEQQPANEQHTNRPVVQRGESRAQGESSAKHVLWNLYNKHSFSPNVIFEDERLSVQTKSPKNVTVIGKPGFQKGKHSWKVRVTGFPDGLSIGICVRSNGQGIVVTFDSGLTLFGMEKLLHVELDCDAKRLSVLQDGHKEPDVLGFENPADYEVHPYFYLPTSNQYMCNKITIVSMDGNSVEKFNNESCCIL